MLFSDSRPLEHSESIQMESFSSSIQRSGQHSPDDKQNDESRPRRKAYAVGIGLLLVVVLLWTSSNFLTQDLYEGGYNKPFLVTYMNTSSFSLYLIPVLIRRWYRNQNAQTKPLQLSGAEYQPLAINEENSNERGSIPEIPSVRGLQDSSPLNKKQTAELAFAFCFIWFIANWSVNASLAYTSVASATILSSTSGFFTLAIGRLFRVEKMTLLKIGAVCTSFLGVIIVALSDSESKQPAGPASHPKPQWARVDSRATLGDILALISALFYAMYVIILKVRIRSESRIDMQLFFGFVGLFNILTCWPLGLVLHLARVEVFELPPSRKAMTAVFVNMAITLSSDYLYVLAMLKTTPLVVTIGLSLTIPLAVVGDFFRRRPAHGEVIAGAALVLLSFVAVGLDDSTEQAEDTPTISYACQSRTPET